MAKSLINTIGLILFIAGIYIIATLPATKALLSKYHLLPEPEKLTELYFENHLSLPQRIVLQKSLPFSFTIHNLEYQDMVYHWQAEAIDDATDIVVASGAAKLANDQKQTVNAEVLLASASGRVMIQVKLVDQNQTIHFWLEK